MVAMVAVAVVTSIKVDTSIEINFDLWFILVGFVLVLVGGFVAFVLVATVTRGFVAFVAVATVTRGFVAFVAAFVAFVAAFFF